MSYVSVTVPVDEVLDEVTDSELIQEVNRRGGTAYIEDAAMNDFSSMLDKIYHKRRSGDDYQQELSDLIYIVIGRI